MSRRGSTTAATPASSSPTRYEAEPRSSWVICCRITRPTYHDRGKEGRQRPRGGGKSRVSQSCYKVSRNANMQARRPRRTGPVLPVATGRRPSDDGCRVRHPSMPVAASMRSPHASTTPTPGGLLRYLDIVLVVAALPFVVFAGLPLLGYAVGALAWIVQRVIGMLLERRAGQSQD